MNDRLVSARLGRQGRVRAAMAGAGLEALVLSLGADLPWLSGYEAMPLERPTVLVVPVDDHPTLVVPRLEAPRVDDDPRLFRLQPWGESEDPLAMVADALGRRRRLAVSDRCWASLLLGLQATVPQASWWRASAVTGPLRAVKDPEELAALAAAGAAADVVSAALLAGEIALVGRTEVAVSEEIGARLRAGGHARVNFAIVASGPNAASPHHAAGDRVLREGDAVVVDIGGTMPSGYCSDCTRTYVIGEPPDGFPDYYQVLKDAQAAACDAVHPGVSAESIDAAAREPIAAAGYGAYFVHRTGHGIGLETHEDPYIVAGNAEPLLPGHAFSIEPGIYPGSHGARIEDIVVVTQDGCERLNTVTRELVVVPAR